MEEGKDSSPGVGQENSSSIKIDSRIQDALDFCSKQGISSFVLALPFEVPAEQIQGLHKDSRIRGVVVCTQDESLNQRFGNWLGAFLPSEYTWKLPLKSAKTIVYIGQRSSISFRMLKASLPKGVRCIVCKTPLSWIKLSAFNLLIGKVTQKLAAKFEYVMRPSWLPLQKIINERKYKYTRVLVSKSRQPRTNTPAIKNRVVLVNSSLVPGGAERQVVNTIKGIREHNVKPFLLCQHLLDRPNHDFYLSEIQELGVPVWQIGSRSNGSHYLKELLSSNSVIKTLTRLSPSLTDEILVYYQEFRNLQPEVVHAWQDFCGIRTGIAGVLAEVPRIVLSFRNVSPRHFHYHQPHFKPAYQALADCSNVIFTNNSLAGARDYAQWLDLPLSRFRVIRNGVDFSHLRNSNEVEKTHFRNKFGISHKVPLIGAVFRFSPEKRPLLWIRMAAEVARKVPEAHFLLMGWGPLQKKIEDLAAQLNLKHRLHIIPPGSNVALTLSSLDMFVLTSIFEGIPNVVLESQWLGIPVVTTNAGGAPEAINPNITGWVVKSAKPEQLARQVLSVLFDADRLRQAKTQGPAFVIREFPMKRMVDETLAAYGYQNSSTLIPFSEKDDKHTTENS